MTDKLVIANWKMNTTIDEALVLARGVEAVPGVETVLCPPFPWLTEVARATRVTLGAQNMYFEDRGGFTGEVSPLMLKGLCNYVLIGQYERRVHFKETDWAISRKVQAALKHGITPVLCVGETADQLEHGETPIVLGGQLESAVRDMPEMADLVVAWDPAWTTMGRATPPPAGQIAEICGFLREAAARPVRVIYGGQVTTRNAGELAALPAIDGVLVGSASLTVAGFTAIARAFSA